MNNALPFLTVLLTDLPVVDPVWMSVALSLLTLLLGFLGNWFWTKNGRRYTETLDQKKTRDELDIKWKQGRLDAEQALRDSISAERAARTTDYLKVNADFERIMDFINRLPSLQDTVLTMTESVKWHGKELIRHDETLKAVHAELASLHQDIKELIRDTRK